MWELDALITKDNFDIFNKMILLSQVDLEEEEEEEVEISAQPSHS